MCRPDRYNEPQRKLLSYPDLVTLLAVQTTRRGSLSITTTSEDSRLVRQAFLAIVEFCNCPVFSVSSIRRARKLSGISCRQRSWTKTVENDPNRPFARRPSCRR